MGLWTTAPVVMSSERLRRRGSLRREMWIPLLLGGGSLTAYDRAPSTTLDALRTETGPRSPASRGCRLTPVGCIVPRAATSVAWMTAGASRSTSTVSTHLEEVALLAAERFDGPDLADVRSRIASPSPSVGLPVYCRRAAVGPHTGFEPPGGSQGQRGQPLVRCPARDSCCLCYLYRQRLHESAARSHGLRGEHGDRRRRPEARCGSLAGA